MPLSILTFNSSSTAMNAKPEETVPNTHRLFNSPDSSVVLRSVEGTYYRLPSFTLRNTSGFFNKLIPSPRTHSRVESRLENAIPINARDITLERVLCLVCGLESPRWVSFDELEDALSLVESWDAPGPLSMIRSAITAPVFLAEPLRLYVITTRFGWEDEAKLASTLTLTLTLYAEEHQPQLQRLASTDLIVLLAFHRRRRDALKAFIDSAENSNAGNGRECVGCGEPLDNHTWRELKAKIFLEMDQRPLGDTLVGLDMEEWPESIACWNSKCQNENCGRLNYNKHSTLRDIKKFLDQLPSSI